MGSSTRSDTGPLANSFRSDAGASGLSKSTLSVSRNDNSVPHPSMNTPIQFNSNPRGGYPYQPQNPHPPGKNDMITAE